MAALGPAVTGLSLVVAGTPQGKLRARSKRGQARHYTPAKTVDYEARVQHAWMEAGRVFLGAGPLGARIVAVHARPMSHFLVSGELSTKGRRDWQPMLKPDGDNLAKGVLDALNKLAFGDDVQLAPITTDRRWAIAGEKAHVRVEIWTRAKAHDAR